MIVPMLQGIDHIHIYVPDKKKAKDWYCENLGFSPVKEFQDWDNEEGPLVIKSATGEIVFALFERDKYSKITSIAMKTDGNGFNQWRQHLINLGVLERVSDHGKTWSLYFQDPFGHNHEITSWDVELINESNIN
ncbi:VOC family protein [Pleionea sediminis]|uniref:VOC family protein n=1 Tax=Pleionea sediminis TaxID=2569479 RepID=UPI001FE72AD8|nr:VOC family protein [Pleionea sediminis]